MLQSCTRNVHKRRHNHLTMRHRLAERVGRNPRAIPVADHPIATINMIQGNVVPIRIVPVTTVETINNQ